MTPKEEVRAEVLTRHHFEDLIMSTAPKLAGEIVPRIEEAVRRGRLPLYLTTQAVLRETGLKRRSQQRLRDSGRVFYRKIGGVIVYKTSELLAELERNKIPALSNETTTTKDTQPRQP